MTIAESRTELNALCCALCCFIQSVTKPTHYVEYVNLSLCGEHHIQQDLTLNLKFSRFRSIHRRRLALDRNRRSDVLMTQGLTAIIRTGWRRCCRYKRGCLDVSLSSSAVSLDGNAIAEARAGYRSADTLGSARPITITITLRKVKRAFRGNIRPAAAVRIHRNSVWVSKASGLHFAGCHLWQCGSGRAAKRVGGNQLSWNFGSRKIAQ